MTNERGPQPQRLDGIAIAGIIVGLLLVGGPVVFDWLGLTTPTIGNIPPSQPTIGTR